MGTKNISSELYRAIPKDVFAAIAVSFACRSCDFSDVENELFKEWMILFENGIVQQKPKKPTKGKPPKIIEGKSVKQKLKWSGDRWK